MTITPEAIQKKEENLSALMHKVLDKPLQPLSKSIEEIRIELGFSQKKIDKITDECGAFADSFEEIKKLIRNSQTQANKLKSEIEQYSSSQTQAQSEATQNIVASINAHALDHTKHLQSTSDLLLTACHTSSQQHTQLTNTLKTWNEDLQQAHAKLLENQNAQAQAAQQATAQMHAALAQQIAASDTAVAERITTAQTSLLTELGNSQQTLAHMQATQTNSHTALVRALNEQHTVLGQQLTQIHNKLQLLTAVAGTFCACTLIYFGYNIWHQLR